jgi:hypothetical protein
MHKTIVFIAAIALAANAQRIETEKPDRNKVMRVETAPSHLTIIELGEPVTEVAAGSSSYKIEWRGNKVFVQPLDPDANTNLFIWTASGRLSYELVPARSVQETVFAIDQEPTLVYTFTNRHEGVRKGVLRTRLVERSSVCRIRAGASAAKPTCARVAVPRI